MFLNLKLLSNTYSTQKAVSNGTLDPLITQSSQKQPWMKNIAGKSIIRKIFDAEIFIRI